MSVNILAFAGSSRAESLNQKILAVAVQAARDAGAHVETIDLRDLGLPLYDGDLEKEGMPPGVETFRAALKRADGLLIASPEYNSGYPALLKNAIDWVSRPTDTEPMLGSLRGKHAGLIAASPSPIGGLRGLSALREMLMNISITVVPTMAANSLKPDSFADDGTLTDEKAAARIEKVAQALVQAME